MTTSLHPQPDAPTLTPDVPVPFHRMMPARPGHRWWRPLVSIVASVAAYAVIVIAALIFVVLATPRLAQQVMAIDPLVPDLGDPVLSWVSSVMLALMIPAVAAGVWIGERRGLGTLSSVAGRLRVGLLSRCLLLAAAVFAVFVAVSLLAGVAQGETVAVRWMPSSLALVAVALLGVPFQAAAEEYVFRALPQQALGSWLKSPWWGILLPVPLFVIGHGYDLAGQISVAVFGLAAGILTWRTGGLEAAIALHVVNNASLYLLGAVGLVDLSATGGSWVGLLLDTAMIGGYTALVFRLTARRPRVR
ncbi:MAG: type II CAAX endopeptidase family protein [Arachnia sp.]